MSEDSLRDRAGSKDVPYSNGLSTPCVVLLAGTNVPPVAGYDCGFWYVMGGIVADGGLDFDVGLVEFGGAGWMGACPGCGLKMGS